MNNDFMNNPFAQPQPQPQYPRYGNGYGRSGRNNQFGQFIPSTNKTFVFGLEDALSRPADYNSEMVYFDQNLDVMYNICTNGRGEKSWSVYNISVRQENTLNGVNAAVATNVQSPDDKRLSAIEDKLSKLEELLNGKYNVKQTDTSND